MFCASCGRKIENDAVFCPGCGRKIAVSVQENQRTAIEEHDVELDRKALTIYLNDVLTLECVKNKYIARINSLSQWLLITSDVFYEKKYCADWDKDGWFGSLYFLYHTGKYYLFCRDETTFFARCPYTEDWSWLPFANKERYANWNFSVSFMDIEQNISDIKKLKMWSQSDVVGPGSFLEKRKKAERVQSFFIKCYEDFKRIAPSKLQENRNNKENWWVLRKNLSNELKSAKALLSKLYEQNIIPNQFRHNIYAVYYLYDFIRSSNQSFSTALLHFDLQEIKIKLDKIIDQQREIIIQQSLIIAQNQEMIEQNRAHLQKLSELSKTAANIENYTSRAATYASIAANNAEVCAWIGLANYLKD